MTEEQVYNYIDQSDKGKLLYHTGKELRDMYMALTGSTFPKSVKKTEIVEALKRNVRARKRGLAFKMYREG